MEQEATSNKGHSSDDALATSIYGVLPVMSGSPDELNVPTTHWKAAQAAAATAAEAGVT